MSIETPDQVKAVVDHRLERERAHELEQRQEVQRRRLAAGRPPVDVPQPPPSASSVMQRVGIKRSYSSHVGAAPPPGRGEHQPPQAKYHAAAPAASTTSTVVRSNLRQIRCVDDSRPAVRAPPPAAAAASSTMSNPSRRPNSNLITLTHNPSPTNITINTGGSAAPQRTQNGNLVSIPLTGGGGGGGATRLAAQHSTTRPLQSCRVLVRGLPSTATFDRVSRMAAPHGPIKTIKLDSGQAEVEFQRSSSAATFQRDTDRKMMDLSVLSVTRLP